MQSTALKYPSDGIGRTIGFLFLALIPLVTLVPVERGPAWLSQDLILRWSSVFIFFLCLWDSFRRSKSFSSLQLDFSNFFLLLLAGWVLLAVKNSRQAFDSFYAFRGFLAMVLWWFSLRMVWKRWPELFPWFERVFFGTALLAAAWVFISTAGRWFWFDLFEKVYPREGFFPNQNVAAGFLGMALVWAGLKRSHGLAVRLTALVLLLLAWGLTESRGAFIAMVLVVVLYLVLHMKETEQRLFRWNRIQWLIFGGGVLLLSVSSALMVNRLLNAEDSDPRSFFRFDVWISSFQMIKAQPWFGFGPGTFADVYPYFRSGQFWNTYNPFAHNEYLQVAADNGLPALGLTLVFIWGLLRKFGAGLSRVPAYREIPTSSRIPETVFFLMLLEAIHNGVDFTFHEWSHRLVLLGFLTYALREREGAEDIKVVFHFSRRACFTGVTLLVLSLAWLLAVGAGLDYLARMNTFRGVLLQRQGDLEGAEHYAKRGLRFRSGYKDAWDLLGGIEDTRAGQMKNGTEKIKHYRMADEYFQRALQCSPYSLDPQENRIQTLVKRGDLALALDLQSQLLEKGPELPTNYLGMGSILMKMGRVREVIAPAQRLIDKYPYFLPGYFLKAQALEQLGRRREALKTYRDAQEMLKKLGLADPSGLLAPSLQRLESQK
jgi:O-antigen ligase